MVKIKRVINDDNLNQVQLNELKGHYIERCEQLQRDPENAGAGEFSKCKQMLADMRDYEAVLYHKNVAQAQRQAYAYHLTAEHLVGKLLIEGIFEKHRLITLKSTKLC